MNRPYPRRGFVHAGAVGAGQQLTVGSRLQYRFEDGWLVCEIHKVIPGVSGCRYDLNCENQQIVLGAWLRASCEHGTEKQWVLWQADSSIAGDPAYAVASVGDDERIMSAPAAGSDIMGAYVKERLANKKKAHVYINFLSPEPNSRHSKTSARAPDGLGQGVSGQPVLPATPPDHQIDRQRCDRASFQAGSPRSQPPLTVRISPHARSHVAWRITHYDQCVSYTRRVA